MALGPFARACAWTLSAGLGLFAGCGEPRIHAPRIDRDIAIDGDYREWQGALRVFEEVEIYVGFFHDIDTLYACVATSRRSLATAALQHGLSLRFGENGEPAARPGLRFPTGLAIDPSGPGAESNVPIGRRDSTMRSRPQTAADPEMLIAAASAPDREIEILSADPPRRLELASVRGLAAQCGLADGVFACEYRIPLRAAGAAGGTGTADFHLEAAPGSDLRVAIQLRAGDEPSGLPSRPDGRPDGSGPTSDGETPGGGFPGGRGQGRGRGGPPGGGRMGIASETIDVVFIVHLAADR